MNKYMLRYASQTDQVKLSKLAQLIMYVVNESLCC
jgi:hypothetical protein